MVWKVFGALIMVFCAAVCADRVGIVVQHGDGSVATDCVTVGTGATAYDALSASRFSIVTKDYGSGLGIALCGIDGTGCPSSNCFCDTKYWAFYQLGGGSWSAAASGISSTSVSEGAVTGFKWQGWGDSAPTVKRFDEICVPLPGVAPVREERQKGLVLILGRNCSDTGVEFNVTDDEGRVTPFAEVNVIRSAPVTKWERVGFVVVDGDGRGSVDVGQPGHYHLEAMLPAYVPARAEVDAVECGDGDAESVDGDAIVGEVADDEIGVEESPVVEVFMDTDAQLLASVVEPSVTVIITNWSETGWESGGWLFGWRPR